MKNRLFETNLQIDNNSINEAANWSAKTLKEAGFDKSSTIRNSFLIEAILLLYQKNIPDSTFNIVTESMLNSYKIDIEIEGKSFDYNLDCDDINTEMLGNLMSTIEKNVSWRYINGKNCISIVVKKSTRIPEALSIIIGVTMAFLVSVILSKLPANIGDNFNNLIIPSIQSKLNAILRMIAGLMVFFSISSSIYAIDNIRSLKYILNRIISRIVRNHIVITIITLFIFLSVFGIGNASSSTDFEGIWNLLLNMIPTDIISPFINGNVIQITIIAVTIGYMLIIAGKTQKLIYDTLAGGATIINMAMQNFCKIMPLFVFINLLSVFSNRDTQILSSLILPLSLGVLSVIVLILLQAVKIWIKCKIPPQTYLMKCLPGNLIGLSTASTSASLDSIKKDLLSFGIEESYIDLMLPLEQAFYKPFSIIIVIASTFAYVNLTGEFFSPGSLAILVILTQIIAIACPSIPGGMLSCLTILVSQMGFPESSMGILVTVSTFLDYFGAMLSVASIHTEIVEQDYINKSRNK